MPNAIQLSEEEAGQVAQQTADEIQQAERDRASLLMAIQTGRTLFLAKDQRAPADKPWPNSCGLVPPTLKQSLNSILADHVPDLLLMQPIFHLEGDGQADKAMQSVGEQFYDRQLTKQVKFAQALTSIFKTAYKDCVGVGVVSWREEYKPRQVWDVVEEQEFDQETQQPIGEPTQKRKAKRILELKYDGPVIIPTPIERVGTFPAANSDIQRSPGLYIKWYVSRYELEQMKESGDFDDKAVATLLATAPDGDPLMPTDTDRGIQSIPNTMKTGPAQGWWITECYWLRNTRKNEPPEDWRIFLHEGTFTILAAGPSPWFSGLRPVFICRPFADEYGIYGDSLVHLEGDVQKAQAALLQMIIDGSALRVDPKILVDENVGKKDSESLVQKTGPGSLVRMSAEGIKNTQKFQTGDPPALLMQVWEMVTKIGQLAVGKDDSALAVQPPQDTTATATADLIEGRNKLSRLQQTGLVEGMKEAAEIIWGMNYQMQGHESLQKIWMEANPDEEKITLQMVMEGKYTFAASGAGGGGNQTLRARRSEERLAFLMQDPVVMNDPAKQYELKHDFLREHGTRDPEIYLGRKEDYVAQMQQIQQQQMQMQQQQMEMQMMGQQMKGQGQTAGAQR